MLGEVGEDFTVKFNMGFLKAVYELAVRKPILFCRGADLDLPEPASVTFFFASVIELECPSVE